MKRILLPALVVVAAFVLARGAVADNSPFPATSSGDTFVIAQTLTTDGTMHDYFKPGDTVVFRAYAVDGKNHKILTEAKVLLRHDPRSAERQVQVRPEVEDGARAVRVDRHVDGSLDLPARDGQLQGARPVEDEAARLVRPDARRDVAADDHEHAAGDRHDAARRDVDADRHGRHGRLRRQRQRNASRRRCAAADRLHADQRVQARRAVRAPHVGLRPEDRRRSSRSTT